MKEEEQILIELKEELDYLVKAFDTFSYAYNNCKKIGIKIEYSYDELDKWEAYTARFSRISDIITQKIMNSIMILTEGYAGSLIDKANFAEQNGLVNKAADFTKLRLLRNYIAHEYTKQNSNEIFEKVMNNYSILKELFDKISQFCSKKIFV